MINPKITDIKTLVGVSLNPFLSNGFLKDSKILGGFFPSENSLLKTAKSFSVFNDEDSEETLTVFDHPRVRIFKRVK